MGGWSRTNEAVAKQTFATKVWPRMTFPEFSRQSVSSSVKMQRGVTIESEVQRLPSIPYRRHIDVGQ